MEVEMFSQWAASTVSFVGADDLGSRGKVVNLSASIWNKLNRILKET